MRVAYALFYGFYNLQNSFYAEGVPFIAFRPTYIRIRMVLPDQDRVTSVKRDWLKRREKLIDFELGRNLFIASYNI